MEYVQKIFGVVNLKTLSVVSLRIIITVVLALVLTRFISAVINRWLKRASRVTSTTHEWRQRVTTLAGAGRSLAGAVIWTIAVMVILAVMGLNIGPILAGAGIAGVALGLGAQHLVRDVLSGIIILLEDQYTVGDVVEIAGIRGTVNSINLRRTVLRDPSGNVHVVPNGMIETVTNMTKEWSMAIVDVAVAYQEDTDRVMALLHKVGAQLTSDSKHADDVLEPLDIPGVQELTEASVVIRCRFKTKPGTQWNIAREFRRLVQKAFSAEGIEIPLPRMSVFMSDGDSLPIIAGGKTGARGKAGGVKTPGGGAAP